MLAKDGADIEGSVGNGVEELEVELDTSRKLLSAALRPETAAISGFSLLLAERGEDAGGSTDEATTLAELEEVPSCLLEGIWELGVTFPTFTPVDPESPDPIGVVLDDL